MRILCIVQAMRFQHLYVLLVPHAIQATTACIRTVCACTPACATRRKRSTGKPNLLVAATCIAVGLCSSAPRDAILEVVGAAALRGDRSDHGESAEENECDAHHDRREKFLWSGFDENCEQEVLDLCLPMPELLFSPMQSSTHLWAFYYQFTSERTLWGS